MTATLILAGCATRPPTPTPAEEAQQEPAIAKEAERALVLDRPLEAAALFEAAAEQTASPLRDRYLVRAAEIYARGGEAATARRLLETVDPAALDRELEHRLTLTRARIDLHEDDADAAWQRLRSQPAGLPEGLARDWRDAQAASLEALGRYLDAARVRSALAESLPAGTKRDRQLRQTWQDLSRLPLEDIAAAMPSDSDQFDAWLELAQAFHRHRIQETALEGAVRDWQRRNSAHPARDFASELLADHLERLRPPEEIALMLPLSGRLAAIGQAIEHGFMAAYFQDTGRRPRVRVFDVGEEGMDVLSAYRDAVEGGVDLVVGPLTKQSLEMLSVWDTFPVPVLALNTVGDTDFPGDRFFQFGLAPEDDARAAADFMAAEGHRSAVLLVPNSEWGDRVASAFSAAFESRQGIVLEQSYYQPQASDFSDPIRSLFNLDASQARNARLQRVLNTEAEFEPRRRQDMDAVFFAAYPKQARLIRPQIRFHHGIDLPVYATSHAYSGQPRPGDDRDMDGLHIVDIPWLLGSVDQLPAELSIEDLAELWPDERARFARLMAMGIDAYRLSPLVDVLRDYPGGGVPAATGLIHVSADGVLHRLLAPAEFRQGRLQPVASEAAPFGGATR